MLLTTLPAPSSTTPASRVPVGVLAPTTHDRDARRLLQCAQGAFQKWPEGCAGFSATIRCTDGDTTVAVLESYAERVAAGLRVHGTVELQVGGSGPARTLVEQARNDPADLVIVASHGRGGRERAAHVPLGSVPERLFHDLNCSMLVIPVPPPPLPPVAEPTAAAPGPAVA